MIVGLTGGIGSGKTTVVNFFKNFSNIAIYIADTEAKKLMNSLEIIRLKLIDLFGDKAYIDNQLNNRFIANIVFKDTEKLKALNSIVHPEVAKHFRDFIIKNKNKSYILYENAILFESKNNLICDYNIMVTSPLKTRLDRVIARDHFTKEEVLDRIKNQWGDEKKALQSHYIIYNTMLNETKKQVIEIHNSLTQKI